MSDLTFNMYGQASKFVIPSIMTLEYNVGNQSAPHNLLSYIKFKKNRSRSRLAHQFLYKIRVKTQGEREKKSE